MNHHQKGTQVNHTARSASLISRASSAPRLARPSSPEISRQPSRVRERSSRRTGFFATLSDSLRAKGSGAPSVRLLAPLALAIAAFLALAAAPASALAAQTHVYTGTSFGPDGTAGTASFGNVQGVAVDQVSGDVYVYDTGAGKIFKFDSAGEPV